MERTSNLVFAVVAVTAFTGTALAQPAPPKRQPVQFARGASEATIKGTLQGRQDVDYVVRASAGQTLTVTLQKTNPQNYFNVLPPGSNDVAMFVGQDDSNFKGVLPDDGEYVVRVYLMRAAARRSEKADYTLTVSVTGKPLAPLPASSDAVLPGTPFHASAPVACTPPFASPGQCDAFVIRRGRDGTATVVLRAKGQATTLRRILFVAGKPVASDATDTLSVTRQGEETVVGIGSDERYTIPDVLLIGG